MRFPALALVVAAALQSQPTFRVGVDLVRVDVSVADKDGRPVSDLRPDDFVVTIDGSPRQVAFARLYGPSHVAAGAPATRPTPSPTYATNRSAEPGRIVVFVVDLESMNAGYEKVLLATAASLVDRLAPGDAVGLLPIPGKGVEITRDHARVREALVALKGFAPKIFQRHSISMQEAVAFEKLDRRIIRELIERECRQYETECPMDLRNEAGQLLIEARRRIQDVVTTLGTLNSRLQPIQAPKDVVLLSAGLPFDPESIVYFRDLQRRVAEGGTATHIVQLAQPETDASSQRMAGTGALPASDLRQGLSMVAGVTGGDFFEGVGRATGAFERIGNEITHSWQLGIEATPQDADGKTHKIAVSTRRQGLTVRARRELILASSARARINPVDLLAQPIDAVELPISAAVYSVRGDEADTLKQIILIHASGIGSDSPPSYALAVLKDDRPVFQTNEQLPVTGQEAQAVIAAQLSPGRYRLRVAVTDASGRGGSLEMPLSVGLRAGGLIQFSDVFAGKSGDRFTPVTDTTAGVLMGALIELYAADAPTLAGATVEFELRRSGTEPILARSAARISTTDLPGRRVADATIATTNVEPGEHTVSALISLNGAIVGRVSRAIQITR
jgi:VWFA-related protein